MTLMSNIDSYLVTGKRVTRIGAVDTAETHCEPTVHLNLEMATSTPDSAQTEGSLGLILRAEDAMELGLALVVMGLGDANSTVLEVLIQRLKQRHQSVMSGQC
jgi:hypothetical protein